MIKLNNITLKYDKNPVIENFSYTFNDTGFYAIKGESGSGKTTLLNAIAGFVKPVSGSIKYDSSTLNINSSISLIFQDNNLFEDLTVKENIEMIISLSNTKVEDNDIINMLTKLKIEQYLKTKVSNISGGERTRVSIAIALLLNKKVIIADEPLSSLDEENSNNIMSLLKELSKERLIILTCHNSYILEEYADYIIDLSNKEQYQENDNTEYELYDSVDNKKKLKVKEVFNIYRKVIKEKAIFKVLLGIILSLLVSMCIFIISISLYSKSRVYLKTIEDNNIDIFSIYNDSFTGNEFSEIEQKMQVRKCYNFANQIYKFKFKGSYKYYDNNFIENVVFDEDITEDEIIITDYIAYTLINSNYYGDSIKDAKELIGKSIIFKCKYSKTYVSLDIKDIIETSFTNIYNKCEDISFYLNEQSGKCFKYVMMNRKVFYTISYESDNVDTISGKYGETYIHFNVDESLSDDEVILNTYLLDLINETESSNLNKGDLLAISLSNRDHIFSLNGVIKDVVKEDYDSLMISPQYMCYVSKCKAKDIEYSISVFSTSLDGYYFSNLKTNEIKNIINTSLNNNYALNFEGSTNIDAIFDEIKIVKDQSFIVVSIIALLSIFFIIYSIIITEKKNRNTFLKLELYGLKKAYEVVILFVTTLMSFLMSLIFGSIIAYFLNIGFDWYLEQSCEATMYYKTFNAISILFIILAILLILVIIYGILYIIITKRKVKSHVIS